MLSFTEVSFCVFQLLILYNPLSSTLKFFFFNTEDWCALLITNDETQHSPPHSRPFPLLPIYPRDRSRLLYGCIFSPFITPHTYMFHEPSLIQLGHNTL